MEIGKLLKELRNKHGLTQFELAAHAGIAQSVISNVEKGGREPSLDSLTKICNVLDISLTDFFALLEGEPSARRNTITSSEALFLERLRQCSPDIRQRVMRACIAFMEAPNSSSDDSFISFSEPRNGSRKTRKYQKRVEGEAAAGVPITAVPDEDSFVSVPEKYLDERYFIVRARGKSMEDTIPDGACCVFQRDPSVDEGAIVLVQIDGATDQPEDTIKRIYRKGRQVELRSDNPEFKSMYYPVDSVNVTGVLITVLPFC